ncbi:MAG TPA: double-strand break repair protein AddB [Roseiarcus sp.]|nr:double-strand break repair protein AddB [Roseiarcus sp.]
MSSARARLRTSLSILLFFREAALPDLRLFSIPAGAPFLASLARALLDGRLVEGFPSGSGPFALANATIYVPTRRAARALGEALRQASGAASLILPRIAPLGAFEPTQDSRLFESPEAAREAPPAISALDRRMALARLTQAWGRALKGAIRAVDASGALVFLASESPLVVAGPAQAFALAGDLAALIDDMTIEGVPWERLETLAPGEFDAYWRITLDFLKIAAAHWPKHLEERGLIDEAARGARLVEDEIARLEGGGFGGPVIVAGSTGARRATAALIAAVARAPQGAVVLPDLDLALDEKSWAMIGGQQIATHPQAGLSRLLEAIGATRQDVREIGAVSAPLRARARLLSEALRPADSTELWRRRDDALAADKIGEALSGLSVIEAADEAEEALALAIAMREALETPGKTAALISPDLGLTRRVCAELARWDVVPDVSAGRALRESAAGVFASLILAAAQSRQPLDLIALLDHPLTRLGRPRPVLDAAARALELGALRGVLPASGLDDPQRLFAAARDTAKAGREDGARARLTERDWRSAEALLADILRSFAPLGALGENAPLAAHIDAHRAALAAFSADEAGADRLTATADGAALAALLAEWRQAAPADFSMGAADYRALFEAVAGETAAPEAGRPQSRLQVLGLLEARLLSFDLALLAGLDETVWPPAAETDAFLNRPMREQLGLSPPERRIGQTAHDLVAALGAPEAILSRAKKRGGAPTVASRFVQRLAAAAGAEAFDAALARGERYLALARAIDRPAAFIRAERPRPAPPVRLRPTKLSVTRIETLRRDPYAIYAERILKLKPLDPIAQPAGFREIGVEWHAALSEFTTAYPAGDLPAEARDRLMAIARARFADLLEDANFRLLNWPRIEQGLDFFLSFDRARRENLERIFSEEKGSLAIALGDGSMFTLAAIADRIETTRWGAAFLVDYKTGAAPGVNEVRVGFAPQLTLEAAMMARGAFPNAPAQAPVNAMYLKLGGAKGGENRGLNFKDEATLAEVAEEHYAALVAMLDQFRDEATPYLPRPYPKFVGSFGVYDHLARVKEWSASGGLADEDSAP